MHWQTSRTAKRCTAFACVTINRMHSIFVWCRNVWRWCADPPSMKFIRCDICTSSAFPICSCAQDLMPDRRNVCGATHTNVPDAALGCARCPDRPPFCGIEHDCSRGYCDHLGTLLQDESKPVRTSSVAPATLLHATCGTSSCAAVTFLEPRALQCCLLSFFRRSPSRTIKSSGGCPCTNATSSGSLCPWLFTQALLRSLSFKELLPTTYLVNI